MVPECRAIITSSMFKRISDKSAPTIICEDCYYKCHYGDPLYLKIYKHNILDDVLGPAEVEKMCKCEADLAWKQYPIEKMHAKFHKCALKDINQVTAEAKIEGMRAFADTGVLSRVVTKLKPGATTEPANAVNGAGAGKSTGLLRRAAAGFSRPSSNNESKSRVTTREPSAVSLSNMPTSDTSFPEFFRKHADLNPFSHVHMALRVGPLLIENGVSE